MTAWGGIPIVANSLVPEETVLVVNAGRLEAVVGPKTLWSLRHRGAWPGLSRYARGVIEAARDRRRQRRR
jgi:hypothetical protein